MSPSLENMLAVLPEYPVFFDAEEGVDCSTDSVVSWQGQLRLSSLFDRISWGVSCMRTDGCNENQDGWAIQIMSDRDHFSWTHEQATNSAGVRLSL